MKLKQILAVLLSSVMVLSASPAEVFAFDDLAAFTDSSGEAVAETEEVLPDTEDIDEVSDADAASDVEQNDVAEEEIAAENELEELQPEISAIRNNFWGWRLTDLCVISEQILRLTTRKNVCCTFRRA